jgi:hypothetical protein
MKREMFWSDDVNGEVRLENNVIVTDCTPSESRALAKKLNDTVRRFCKEERPVDKVRKKIGRMTREEQRLVLLMRYAVMYVLDHES